MHVIKYANLISFPFNSPQLHIKVLEPKPTIQTTFVKQVHASELNTEFNFFR